MPTPSNDLDAALAAFEKAAADLSKAQEANTANKTPVNTKALAEAQEAYKRAGQEYRRAKDPDRALDILEFNRHLAEKAKLKARKAKATAGA